MHPVEQRELFLDLLCFALQPLFLALWPTADCVYSCSICISLAGSRRQLSIRKNERKGESDGPDAPLLWEVDVVIGGEKSNQANNAAKDGYQQGLAVKPQPPRGWRRSQVPRKSTHLKQSSLLTILITVVHTNFSSKSRWGLCWRSPLHLIAAGVSSGRAISAIAGLLSRFSRPAVCGSCALRWQIGLDKVDFGVHPA